MTFIIPESTPVPVRRGPDIAPSTNAQAMGAAARDYLRSVNAFMQRQQQVVGEQDALAAQAMARLGPQGMKPIIEEFNRKTVDLGLPERTIPEDAAPDDIMGKLGANGSKAVLEAARAAALADPEAWADLDISPEGIEARVTERRKADAQADADLIAMSPNPTRSSIIGSLAGGLVDPVNLALMPFGLGGGSILRIMGREAMLGAAAEGIQYPTATKVAAELDQQAPDLMKSLAIGAAGGAVLGGAIEGVPRAIRALTYYRGMKGANAPAGISPATHEAAIQKAEEALVSGADPLKAVRDVLASEPPPRREPLILTPDMSVTARTPEPTPLAPDPITTQSLPPIEGQAPTTPGETAAMAEAALDDAAALRKEAIGKKGGKGEYKSPFLSALKSAGVRVDPDTPEGQALKALGITNKTLPGFFSRKAKGERTALDTLVASEWESSLPGIWDATGTPRDITASGGEYLDLNGVMDVLRREQGGDLSWIRALDDAARLEKDADTVLSGRYNPQDAYLAGDKIDDDLFFNPDPFDDPPPETFRLKKAEATDRLNAFMFSRGIRDILPSEVDEIASQLARSGGDGKILIERFIHRDIDEVTAAMGRRMRGDANARADEWLPEGSVAGGADQPGAGPIAQPEAVARGEGEAGAGNPQPASTERTDAGIQSVIPGSRVNDSAARQAERATAEAAAKSIQSKMRKNGQLRVEDDVNGLFAVKQLDIFDDINSPEAQAFMDANVQGMRDILEAEGDIAMDAAVLADDGSALSSLSGILREIDDMDTLASEFAKCRTGASE